MYLPRSRPSSVIQLSNVIFEINSSHRKIEFDRLLSAFLGVYYSHL